MTVPEVHNTPSLFATTLEECRKLYVDAGRSCVQEYPQLIAPHGETFVERMENLHRGLVLKIYLRICEADKNWSPEERFLGETLFEHVWGKRLASDDLRAAARQASASTRKLEWYSLVKPFDQVVPLREHIGTLETLVTRLANIVARADGDIDSHEANAIKSILDELRSQLRPVPIDEPTQHEETGAASQQAIESLAKESGAVYDATRQKKVGAGTPARRGVASSRVPAKTNLQDALAELDSLIGLTQIKDEVRTLTNYLKLQKRRGEAGLPGTDVSLHMVFTGNPGTGKTTIARILGKIFGAMGILAKGHLVETDRAGLVAEYIGQTAPKTHAKIDEALDGVLFIDEAYGLVARQHDDPFGYEAVHTLLKRAEDDRQRLIVILAGYPDEMKQLLISNPGLSSRFNRVMHFDDYTPVELAKIFGFLCEKNHYKLGPGARPKLILGLTELHRRRDRHFGNGRAARNLFELAIRRMANRIADVPHLTQEQLMQLDAVDLHMPEFDAEMLQSASDDERWRFRICCSACGQESKCRGSFLGREVKCPKCQQDFVAAWGEVEAKASE